MTVSTATHPPEGQLMTRDFFTPKLSGARFDDHTVPADVLPDIAALQEMLVELAKQAYMREHPERTRVARNFDLDVQIHLAGIEEGSAKLKLVLFFAAGLFPPYEAAFQTAQAEITSAVRAASLGQQPILSQQHLAYFDRLGRGLREGESFDFPTDGGYAVLNQKTRHRLIEASKVEEWTERATLRVRVPMADYRTGKFDGQLSDGSLVPGKLEATLREPLGNAHDRYGSGKDEWLLLQCVVRKDRSGKIKGIESVEHAVSLDPLDIPLRLQELSQLRQGWLDGKGAALDAPGLDWLSSSFASHFDQDLVLPHLYPTPEGKVLAEWTFGRQDVALEVDLGSKRGEYAILNLDSGDSEEETLELSNEAGWKQLVARLTALRPAEGTGA